MKKILLFFSFLSLLISCNDESVSECVSQKGYFNSKNAIESYIQLTQGIDMTRASDNDFDLTPYIIEGDTVMYIVNYNPGWQLFSNCCCSPLVLAYSASGSLNIDDILDCDSPQAEHIRMLGEDIHQLNQNIDPSLVSNVQSDTVPIPSRLQLIRMDTLLVTNRDHLLQTKWGANQPWNSYIRFVNGQHGKVGCTAIGVGQYLYYQHYKTGVPATAMSCARLENPSDIIYTFSNPSTTIWDKMACTRNPDDTGNTDSTAVFLAYIAEAMNGRFTESGTSTRLDSCQYFLRDQGFSFSRATFDYDYIINSIMDLEPVIVAVNTDPQNSHLAIVDGVRIETVIGYFQDPQIFHNVISRRFQNKYFKFNWGYEGYSDDAWYVASSSADWETVYYNPNTGGSNPLNYRHDQQRLMFKKTN